MSRSTSVATAEAIIAGNSEPWNLAVLCQRCHLSIQGRVNMFQDYMLDHTDWMQPHVEGRNRAIVRGEWPR